MTDVQPNAQDAMGFQFSIYPLRQSHLRPAITAAARAATEAGVKVTVGHLSTFAQGDEDSVFRALRAAYSAAKSFGSTAMVITLTSGVPSVATVGAVQTAAEESA